MKFFEQFNILQTKNIPFTLVTLVETRGGAPQDPGAKMLVTTEGLNAGTIGGGKIEKHCISYSIELLQNKETKPVLKTWNLQKDIGMTCGGEVTLLFENNNCKNTEIAIFGAGHVSQALCQILSYLPFQVSCIDSRAEWLEKLPLNTKKILAEKPEDFVSKCSPHSFFISMTMGHAFDLPIVKKIFEHFPEASYIGVIGSETKAKVLKADLLKIAVSQDFCDKIHIPIGLPLGNNDPYEIAISICAELLKERDALHNMKKK